MKKTKYTRFLSIWVNGVLVMNTVEVTEEDYKRTLERVINHSKMTVTVNNNSHITSIEDTELLITLK